MGTVYRFGPFEVRAEQLELRRDGVAVRIEPKPVELLVELLRHTDELVTKAELMDTVWADRVVTESVIARCVNKLRDALGDDTQTLLRTVHGYGYRLTAAVAATEETTAFSTPPAAIVAGFSPPLRPNWRLVRTLDQHGEVWLAEHHKTGDQRVYKFATSAARVRALRRELTIHRLLAKGLGTRDDIAHLLDYEFSAPPYFLELEYCPLGNLTAWCAGAGGAASLTLELRLRLVAELADALGAAHALGVLHMDIKPSNVLIWTSRDGTPHGRWCDFGSGHLLEPDRLAALGITQLDPPLSDPRAAPGRDGTLHYLAPELLQGEPPTIRSDLYALGVVLYQLAAGDLRRPLAAGWERDVDDELLREDIGLVANDDPTLRPSSADDIARRLRTRAARRTALDASRRLVAEASHLRQRLERARARRPWLAALGVALLLALGASLVGYREVRIARDEARAQAAQALAVTRFLERDVLALSSPFSVGEYTPEGGTVHAAMQRAAARLGGRFPAQPAIEAALRTTIGLSLLEGGDVAGAERELKRAMTLGAAPGPVEERALQAAYLLVYRISLEQRLPAARQLLDETNRQAARHATLALETVAQRDAMNGNYYLVAQQYAAAVPFLERALADWRAHDRSNVTSIVSREIDLAWAYAQTGRFDRAEPLCREALEAVRRAEPAPGMQTGMIEQRYGINLFLAGRDAEARALLEAGLAHLRGGRGAAVIAAETLSYIGWLDLRAGRTAAAITELREAQRELAPGAMLAADHWTRLRTLALLGLALTRDGHPRQGLPMMATAVAGYDAGLGADAADAQLFRLLYLEEAVAAQAAPADLAAQAGRLQPARLAEGAPWSGDWSARIARLQAAATSTATAL